MCRLCKTNFLVRNCRICQLKSSDPWALLVVLFLRRHPSLQFNHGGIGMNNKLLSCLIAGALATTLALASPALARGGGGGHGGGMGGGHWGGGMGGGHWSGGMGGGHWAGMRAGPRFSSARFAGAPLAAHAALSPRFSHAAFSPRFSHAAFSPRFSRFAFHHRFHHHRRFAFFGGDYLYASYYDDCWRSVWTRYGLQWVNVCGYYGY
jgi:hypothetical protein